MKINEIQEAFDSLVNPTSHHGTELLRALDDALFDDFLVTKNHPLFNELNSKIRLLISGSPIKQTNPQPTSEPKVVVCDYCNELGDGLTCC